MLNLKTVKTLAIASAVAVGAATGALAFPDKPIEYIIPFGPGGESDISARFQQPFFKDKFGQDLVVSYKPGGGGAVGWAQLNSMNADGYTIMGINLPHIVIQPAQKDVGYTTDDINAFYMFHYTPDAIVVTADSPYQTLEDLVEDAKANPGSVTMSGSGKATANHLAQIRFDKMAGITTTYVPFKGTGASTTANLGNQVKAQWGYTTVGAAQGDAVRLLAVAMEERHPLFPDVPTFKELGYDMVGGAYRGMAVPKDTPEDIVTALSDAFGEVNADEEFRKQMIDGGFALLDVGADEMDAFMEARKAEYIDAATEAGLLN
ncbi:tripartite tricarboxylate transporter substrate binding protein [Hoeflea sp.]|uniref:tripartite tricarboxylate transporter substrate binding protein n=1 Tax=Hoeflea sp. TaxID=1940281 RepID=UPI003B51E894